jgi:hypothetical protein
VTVIFGAKYKRGQIPPPRKFTILLGSTVNGSVKLNYLLAINSEERQE